MCLFSDSYRIGLSTWPVEVSANNMMEVVKMKKVLFVLIALCLISTPAFALSVKNSKHNLSSGATSFSGTGTIFTTNVSGICIFCHTPHAASTTVSTSPLWNRDISGDTVAAFYNSTTLTNDSGPAIVGAQYTQTDALLCLSCHDGSGLGNGLVNPSNEAAGGMTWNSVSAIPATSFANVGDYGHSGTVNAGASDLRDDHPIAMVYSDVYTNTPAKADDFFAVGAASPISGVDPQTLLRTSAAGDLVWCSSCHDVHDNTYVPFLRIDNTNSNLCLTCHNK